MKRLIEKQFKKLIVFMMTFVIMIPLVTENVSAASGGTLSLDYSVGWSLGGTSYGQEGIMMINGQIVYCLERTKDYDTGAFYEVATENDLSAVGLSEAQAKKLSLMTYFAKQRAQQTGNKDWYAIAQNAVWKESGNFNGWVLSPTFDTKAKIDTAIAQLEAEVTQYYVKPSFHGSTQSIKVGETITLTDTNGVLSTFSVRSSDGLSVSISGNTLTVTATSSSPDLSSIIFQKKVSAEDTGTTIMYSAGDNKQKTGQFRITDPERSFLDFNVEQNGSAQFTKVDENGDAVQGLVFEYSTNQSTILGTVTTGTNGQTPVINDLTAGTLYVREKSGPVGLVIDASWHAITINAGATTTYNATNKYQDFSFTITKTENGWDTIQTQYNHKPIAGVEIGLYAAQDLFVGSQLVYRADELIGTQVTNEAGQVSFHNLPAGVFTYRELTAPNDYVIDGSNHSVTLSYDASKPTTETLPASDGFTNQVKYGQAQLVKTDGGRNLLEGAVFNVYAEDGALVAEGLTSDQYGVVLTPELRYGAYTFVEQTAPLGYYLDQTPIPFTISEHQSTVTVTMPNKLIEAKILVQKVDGDSSLPLADVGFQILDNDLNVVSIRFQQGTQVVEKNEWFTDENGEFLLEAFLPYGTYTLVESKPLEGYQPVAPIQFTIDADQPYVELDVIGTVLDLGSVENFKNRGNLLIEKLDVETGLPLTGFGFNLYNSKMELVGYYETGDDGTVLIEALIYDVYTVEEIKVNGDYGLDLENNKQTIFIEEHAKTYTVTFENKHAAIKTSLSFTERDKESPNIVTLTDVVTYTDLIPGKEYTMNGVLMDKATGEAILIDESPVTGSTTFTPTHKDGTVNVLFTFDQNKLKAETVVAFETLVEGEREVVVHHDIDDIDQTLEIITVRIHKIDSVSKEELPFAEFTQYDQAGNIISVVETDSSGIAEFKVLEGEYAKLAETKAPVGYMKSEEVIEIIGSKEIDGNHYSIEFENDLLPAMVLPTTGTEGSLVLQYSALASLFGLAILLFAKTKEKLHKYIAKIFAVRHVVDSVYFDNDHLVLNGNVVIKRYTALHWTQNNTNELDVWIQEEKRFGIYRCYRLIFRDPSLLESMQDWFVLKHEQTE